MPGAAAVAEPAQVIHLTVEIKQPPKTLLQTVIGSLGDIAGALAKVIPL
jgi:hypothetical protein